MSVNPYFLNYATSQQQQQPVYAQTMRYPSDDGGGYMPPGGGAQTMRYPSDDGGGTMPPGGGIQTQRFPSDDGTGFIPPSSGGLMPIYPPNIGGPVQTLAFPSDDGPGITPPPVAQPNQAQLTQSILLILLLKKFMG